ncbi:MAG: TonB-dependent receptor [Gammaproteobacteria bacterium]|nr:TonB-dependent receptor [Gammaproteobacteria bacterium]
MLQLLEEDMQEYSRIATQTRQNVDYMPYIISAWNSDDLIHLGISTLRDALSLVPGIDLSIGTVGITTPIFRGSNPFAMGQSKLVIDGVVVNDKMTGSYGQFLDMPVSLIQRIEIVRGPGSLLSYVNGYAGSIHVITKANRDDGLAVNNEAFVELGSKQYRTGGFVLSHQENELSVSSDLFYKTHEQSSPVSADRYGTSGDAEQWLDNYSLGINADYNNFSIKSRLSKREAGASYGQSFSLSEDDSDFVSIENNFIELGYSYDISKNIKLELSLGYIELIRQLQNKVIPDAAMPPDGRYFLVNIAEETFHERAELQITSINSHQINLGIHSYQSDMANRDARFSTDNMQTFTDFEIINDTARNMYSLYIDDLIDITEKTSIQLGAKYDHYSDVDNQLSPRLALVHRYDNENIYKFMYTHSYREPSWREQYLTMPAFFSSTADIKPEIVDAYEFGYIRKINLQDHIKMNAYYLKNKDQIHAQNPTHTFKNSGNNNLYGYEIEYKNEFSNSDQFYFTYSYVHGKNVADVLASSSSNLVNAYYIHNFNNAISISTIAKFIDEKSRIATDMRSNVDSYTLIDLTINYQHRPGDVNFNLSVKNLFDEDYYLPSPETTYPDDYKQVGRSILFGLKKKF